MQQEQPTFSDSQFARRASDHNKSEICETGSDIWKEIAALNTIVNTHQRHLEGIISSFPANDLGQPGYEVHRVGHLEQIKANELLKKYKSNATSKIIGALAVFLAGALASGFVETLKRILLL